MDTPETTQPPVQLVEVSTLYGLASVCAAIDAGFLPLPPGGRRLLITSNNADVPESQPAWDDLPGFRRLASRFERVVDWNALAFPRHPNLWRPSAEDMPLLARCLRESWAVPEDAPIQLVLESLQVPPAQTLAHLFREAELHVYADGLMTYGPLRAHLANDLADRIRQLIHPDLVTGLRPLLLSSVDARHSVLPPETLRAVFEELAEEADAPLAAEGLPQQDAGLVVGQYLAEIGLLSAAEEDALHQDMVRLAARQGCTHVVFKPHPRAPRRHMDLLRKTAAEAGVAFFTAETPVLAEVLLTRLRPRLVVGCFSTALFTASALYGIPALRLGTERVLRNLRPYENSNRIPLVLADQLLPDGSGRAPFAVTDVRPLVETITYCMQPEKNPRLRPVAERFLNSPAADRVFADRHIGMLRLTRLSLPGGLPLRGRALRLATSPTLRRHRARLAKALRSSSGLRTVLRLRGAGR